MDSFIISIWYFIGSLILLIFEGGYLYTPIITAIFIWWAIFKRPAWDDSVAPFISAIIYLIIWFIMVISVYGFIAAIILSLFYIGLIALIFCFKRK